MDHTWVRWQPAQAPDHTPSKSQQLIFVKKAHDSHDWTPWCALAERLKFHLAAKQPYHNKHMSTWLGWPHMLKTSIWAIFWWGQKSDLQSLPISLWTQCQLPWWVDNCLLYCSVVRIFWTRNMNSWPRWPSLPALNSWSLMITDSRKSRIMYIRKAYGKLVTCLLGLNMNRGRWVAVKRLR